MYNLTHRDIELLAASDQPELRLEKLCEARWSRALELGKLSIAASAGLLTSLFVAAWKGELTRNVDKFQASLVIGAALTFLFYGGWQFSRISLLQRRYLVALGRLHYSIKIARGLDEARKALGGGGV